MTRFQWLIHTLFHNDWAFAGGNTARCRRCGIVRRCGWAKEIVQ